MRDTTVDQAGVELSVTSQLIEDYLYAKDHEPLALGGQKSLAALGDGLAAIDNDKLVFIRKDRVSKTGWVSFKIPVQVPQTATDPRIVSILGFEVGSAWGLSLNVLCFYKASEGFAICWMCCRKGSDDWKSANLSNGALSLISQVENLSVFDAGSDFGTYIYGVTTQPLYPGRNISRLFTLYIPDYRYDGSPLWLVGSQREVSDFGCGIQARPRFVFAAIAPQSRQACVCALWWDTAVSIKQGNKVTWGKIAYQRTGFTSDMPGSLTKSWVTESSLQHVESNRLKEKDSKNWDIYTVSADNLLRWITIPVDGSTINQYPIKTSVDNIAVVSVEGTGVGLFATDLSGRLDVLREINRDAYWVRLGNIVSAFAVPNHTIPVLEVFYGIPSGKGNDTYDLYQLTQDKDSHLWIEDKIGDIEDTSPGVESGATAPKNISSVAIQASVVRNNGVAAGSATIKVNSDQWSLLVVDDFGYWVGPGSEVSLKTDTHGTITILQRATSLKFAELGIYAIVDGTTMAPPQKHDPVTPTRYCRGDYVQNSPQDALRKGQWRPDPPTTTVAKRLAGEDRTFDLRAKLVGSKGTILPPEAKKDDIDHLNKMLNDIGAFMLKHQGEDRHVKGAWTFSSEPTGFSCQPLVQVDDHAAEWSVTGVWGDITHLAKRVLTTVKRWDVVFEDATLRVRVWIDNVEQRIEAKTLQEAGDLVETIFVSIAKSVKSVVKVIEEVVAFLHLLFDWGDIKRSHIVIKQVCSFCFEYAKHEDKIIEDKAIKYIIEGKDKVSHYIADAINLFEKSEISPSSFMSSKFNVDIAGPNHRTQLHNHRARLQYIHHRSKSKMDKSEIVVPHKTDEGDEFVSKSSKWALSHQDHAKSLFDKLKDMNAEKILDTAIVDILKLVRDIVSVAADGFEEVIRELFRAIRYFISQVTLLLNRTINIPLISWIYKKISDDPLTILDVICLIMAVPATILYKIFNDGKAPFDNSTQLVIDTFRSDGKLDLAPLREASRSSDFEISSKTTNVFVGLQFFSAAFFGVSVFFTYRIDNNLVSAISKGEEPGTDIFTNWLGWFFSLTANVMCMPLSTWVAGGPEGVLGWQTALWGLGIAGYLIDLIFLIKDGKVLRNEKFGKAPGWETTLGALLDGLIGGILFILMLVYLSLEHKNISWPTFINALSTNLTRWTRFLIAYTPVLEEQPDPVAVAEFKVIQYGTLAFDIITHISAFVTLIWGAIVDNEETDSLLFLRQDTLVLLDDRINLQETGMG